MEALILRLREKNLELKQVLKSLKADYDSAVDELEGYKLENSTIVNKLQMFEEMTKRQPKQDTETIQQLRHEVEILRRENAAIKEEEEHLKSQLHGDAEESAAEVRALERNIRTLESQIERKDSELQRVTEELRQCKQQQSEDAPSLAALRAEAKQYKTEASLYRNKLDEAKKQLQEASEQLAKSDQEIRDARNQVEIHKKKSDDFKSRLKRLEVQTQSFGGESGGASSGNRSSAGQSGASATVDEEEEFPVERVPRLSPLEQDRKGTLSTPADGNSSDTGSPGRRLSPAGERPSTPTVLNSLPIRFGPKDPHSPGRMLHSPTE